VACIGDRIQIDSCKPIFSSPEECNLSPEKTKQVTCLYLSSFSSFFNSNQSTDHISSIISLGVVLTIFTRHKSVNDIIQDEYLTSILDRNTLLKCISPPFDKGIMENEVMLCSFDTRHRDACEQVYVNTKTPSYYVILQPQAQNRPLVAYARLSANLPLVYW